jgi:hypothetical protein
MQITVHIRPEDMSALERIAIDERRSVRSQAAMLLEEAIRERRDVAAVGVRDVRTA